MSVVARETGATLRRPAAEAALARAALGTRLWASDMAAAGPAIPVFDALPGLTGLDVLLDPLADSALATAAFPAARGASPAVDGSTERPSTLRHAAAGARRVAPGALRAPASGAPTSPASGGPHEHAAAARPAAGIASLPTGPRLASTHPDGARSAHPARDDGGTTAARTVVPFPRRRDPLPEAVASARPVALPRADTVRSRGQTGGALLPPRLLLRWAAAASSVLRRITPALQPDAAPPAWSGAADEPPARGERTPGAAHAERPMVRLADVLGPAADAAAPAGTAPPAAASSETAPTAVAAAGSGSLGRVVDALARIEERLAANAPPGGSPTQWLEDDDGLAARIQGILRRQVERHGIDAP